MDFLWGRGCSSANPSSDSDPQVNDDFENECLCYHGRPDQRILMAYDYLYSQYKISLNNKLRCYKAKRVVYSDGNFGIYSRKFIEDFLLNPDSEIFKQGKSFETCPCSKLSHFGMDPHAWLFDANLSLYFPMVIGNMLKNSYLESPEVIGDCYKKPYFSKVVNESDMKRIENYSSSIPKSNALVKYLLSEGYISKISKKNPRCHDGPLGYDSRERSRTTGWEDPDDSVTENSTDSDSDRYIE